MIDFFCDLVMCYFFSSENSYTFVSNKNIYRKETKVDLTAKTVNYIQKNIENKRIGDLDELWVVEYEKQKLISANKPKLAKKISHLAKAEGDLSPPFVKPR